MSWLLWQQDFATTLVNSSPTEFKMAETSNISDNDGCLILQRLYSTTSMCSLLGALIICNLHWNTGILSLLSSVNWPFRKLRSRVYIHKLVIQGARVQDTNRQPHTKDCFFLPFVTFCQVMWTTWPIPVQNSGFEPHIVSNLLDIGREVPRSCYVSDND